MGEERFGTEYQTRIGFRHKASVRPEGSLYSGGQGQNQSQFLSENPGIVDLCGFLEKTLRVTMQFETAIIAKPSYRGFEPERGAGQNVTAHSGEENHVVHLVQDVRKHQFALPVTLLPYPFPEVRIVPRFIEVMGFRS
jgi:hypothetical protein